MSRPIDLPSWATNTNHPAGTDDWSGQPCKVEPSAGSKAGGFVPNTDLPGEEVNWLLNNKALWLRHHDNAMYREFHLKDEFCGSAINTALWTLVEDGAASAITVADDETAAGKGATSFVNDATAATIDCALYTTKLDIGTVDLYFAARVRVIDDSAPARIYAGFGEPGTADAGLIFRLNHGSGEWEYATASDGSVGAATGTAATEAYQLLEIARIDGVAYWYIDGTLEHSEANVVDLSAARVFIATGAVNAAETRFDFVSAWAAAQ